MTDRERLDRIRQITPYFAYWQGLKSVPMGAMLLGLIPLMLSKADSVAFWVVYGAMVVAGILLYLIVSSSYKQFFGTVFNSRVNGRLDSAAFLVAIVLGAIVWVDMASRLPIALTGFAYAAFILWAKQCTGGGRPHYFWLAAVYFLFGFAPFLGVKDVGLWIGFMVLSGGTLILMGILDHLELMRIFRPIKDDHGIAP